jgi:hypothetical protein
VRETVQLSLGALLTSNWAGLSCPERQAIKDAFVESFSDGKPEVQQLGRAGLAAYLSYKTMPELATLAAAYVRNSEALVARYVVNLSLSLSLLSLSSHSSLPLP